MKASVIQCPNCGAPLEVTGSDKGIVCPSCGSSLELTTGESGFPMARLVAMSQDTSFLAMRQAADRLKEQISSFSDEKSKIQAKMKNPHTGDTSGCLMGLLVPFVIVGIILATEKENASFFWVFLIIAIVLLISYFVYDSVHLHRVMEEAQRKYQPELDRVERDIALKKEQLAKIEHDLDSRTTKM